MTKKAEKRSINRHLKLVWDRDGANNILQSEADAGSETPTAASLAEDSGLNPDLHDPMAALVTSLFDLEGAEDASDGLDVDPEALEEIRLKFAAIEDAEELALAFLDGEWWHFTELHDELRRACLGVGKNARYLARQSGFEFIVGAATTLAYRGSGPLSTQLTFNSEYPERFAWDEIVITLNEPNRKDALELTVNLSFMMH